MGGGERDGEKWPGKTGKGKDCRLAKKRPIGTVKRCQIDRTGEQEGWKVKRRRQREAERPSNRANRRDEKGLKLHGALSRSGSSNNSLEPTC
jgi:hypothetical protein